MALTLILALAMALAVAGNPALVSSVRLGGDELAGAGPGPQLLVIRDEPQASSWNNRRLQARPLAGYSSAAIHPSYRYMGLLADQPPAFTTQHAGTKGGSSGARRKPSASKSPTTIVTTTRQHHLEPKNQTISTRVSTSGRNRKNLVCYYGSWAVYRPDAGKYPVENIDPFLCTHIIYGFTGLSHDNLIKPLDPWNDLEDNYGKGAMKRFTSLKRQNPELKTLVAIGGWNEGSIKYSRMAAEPEQRARFTKSVLEFLAKYNFDGLDLDWEYPGSRGGHSYDKQNFVKLLRELKEAFAPHGYLLTAAVSAGKWFIEPAYDIPQVSKYLDLINLMAYDYHGGWEPKTGMNAPLFASRRHDMTRQEQLLNVNWSVNYWLQQGAPREKLMLGVGTYGRSFTLDRAQEAGINAPASQKGRAGPYTREPGSLGYNEICESFQRQPNQWTIVRDPDYLAPYAYHNNERQWVGYDDMESLALKAQFAQSMGLGGMMVWSLETDDFQGRCHGQKYPLLSTLRRTLDGGRLPGPGPSPGPTTARPAPRPTATTPGHEVEEDGAGGSGGGGSTLGSSTTSTTTRRPAVVVASSTTRRPPRPAPARPTSTTSTSTTQRPRPPTPGSQTGQNDQFGTCPGEGMFADPADCRRFVRCVQNGGPAEGGYTIYRFACGPGTAFNEEHQYCDFVYNVPRCRAGSLVRSEGALKRLA